jgi:hypothetical protein
VIKPRSRRELGAAFKCALACLLNQIFCENLLAGL